MTQDLLISADSHVAIHLSDIRDRLPQGMRTTFDDALAAQAALDEELRGGRKALSLDDFDMEAIGHPGYYDPHARLEAMDRDRVQAEVLYSEVSAFRAFGLVKGDWKPISRAFTDHLSEFAAVAPDRLAVSYQVPILDIEYAVQEVERLAALGARSVHLPNFPSEFGLKDYHDESYGPLWDVLQETGISISFHLGNRKWLYDVFRRDPTPQAGIFTSMPGLLLSEVIAWWILTGTLERYPRLKMVFVEPQLYWIPGFLAGLDRKAAGAYRFEGLTMKPSEYFRRNMAATFMDDEIGLAAYEQIGAENILWSTDFPHPATTWPNSQAVVARQFSDIGEDVKQLICAGNARRIYDL